MRTFSCAVFILVVLCVTGAAVAQGLGFYGIGGRLSYVNPENIGGTFGLGAHADFGEITQNLVLYPSLEYWGKSEGSFDFSQVSINGDVRYYFPSASTTSFFAGGGLAILFSSTGVEDLDSASATDIGLDILGGVDVPINENLVFTGKAKFVISDGNVFKISAGLTYAFTK
jgi:hypothetical protein